VICPNCRSSNDDSATTCFGCGHTLFTLTSIRKGTVLADRYEVQSTLGKGGMGMVFKAHDRVLDETVALKIMRAEAAENADMARRFRQEIKLARKVRHRNVCNIHEYGEVEGMRYIAMEYVEGVDLRQILRAQGPPLPAEAFEIAIQLCEGLQAIHDAGIIHRDLKTPNIMRDNKGVVRLMDFGIAKQFGEATLSGTAIGMIVGTPEYMSPEQARGQKIDFRSDIYALGIVIFEIFTGDVPFRGDTPLATIFKHFEEPPTLIGPGGPVVPEPMVPVLSTALAKDPANRYASPFELEEAIIAAREAVLGPMPVTATTRRSGSFTPASGRPAVNLAALPTPMPVTQRPTPVPTAVPTQAKTTAMPAGTMLSTLADEDGVAQVEKEQGRRTDVRRPPAGRAPVRSASGSETVLAEPMGRRSPGGGRGRAPLVGAAIALAVVVAGVAVWRMRSAPAPSAGPGPAPSPITSTAPPAADTGLLIVDATPWGEVSRVVDDLGKETPLASRYTPLPLVLPFGSYTVTVTNPSAQRPITLRVAVEKGRTQTVRAEFETVDVAEYFRATGW
jgi:tRNA A-37 threonylcarbamoyl transferase component Bud32